MRNAEPFVAGVLFLLLVALVALIPKCVKAQTCDPNCDPNDPICIPCDLDQLGVKICTVECYPHPHLGQYCVTICREVG